MRIENRPLSELRDGNAAEMVCLVTADDLYVFASAWGILNSRSDSAMSRLTSCAVAALHHARLTVQGPAVAAAAE